MRMRDVREKQENVQGEKSSHSTSSGCIVSLETIVHFHSEPIALVVIGKRVKSGSRRKIAAEELKYPWIVDRQGKV